MQVVFSIIMMTTFLFTTTSFRTVRPQIPSSILVKLYGKSKPKSSYEPETPSPKYLPSTENQKKYVDYLHSENVSMVICSGAAGSGKTLFACTTAIDALKKGKIQKIILTRPSVSVDQENLGFLPGSVESKMNPWTKPFFDIIQEHYTQAHINNMIQNCVLEVSPLAFMRGRTFKNSFIIADEMQNSSPTQMLMLTTRIGDNSKLVITGDVFQSDYCGNNNYNNKDNINGLEELITKIKTYKGVLDNIKHVEMETSDIKRSKLVTTILNVYGIQQPLHANKKTTTTTPKANTTTTISNINNNGNLTTTKQPIKRMQKDDCALIPLHLQTKNYR